MKSLIKRIYVAVFLILFSLPLVTINTEESVVSPIDNRELAPWPLSEKADPTFNIAAESYLKDRIGFRNEAILHYAIANDALFGTMVHPTYEYGTDGYVYFAKSDGGGAKLTDYHVLFAQTVKKIQDYCDSKEIPFIFVFEPIKNSVITDHLPRGINYDRSWVDAFLEKLDSLGVRYVDLTPLLKEKYENGEVVFNKIYNAGHWNDRGAFFGVNEILAELQKDFPNIKLNEENDFVVTEEPRDSLMVSEFPIKDTDPIYTPKFEPLYAPEKYADELPLDPQYKTFFYYENVQKQAISGTPRTLVFQGSYTNGMGYKFFANALPEYIGVHNYQNVLNIDWYVDYFQPDAVIFEVAEYTLSDTYFSTEKMQNLQLP